MTKPNDYDDDIENDSYTAAGAAPGASVPCSFSRVPAVGPLNSRTFEQFVQKLSIYMVKTSF